ncbi:SRPBCC domain-containing protein [Inquilinus sp. CAU 1745]|uniref:SRPBCC domain-containing protein n=1 Tax=Inquilinus sp. CAU 1745 TaxID=3140369 RepID=UPI00325B6A44
MKITTQALIDAPIDIVWRAFNAPADILKWDISEDWQTTWASNDLRIGGLLKLRIASKHNGSGFDFVATYTAIEPMRVIEWREGDRVVRVEFKEGDAGVVVNQTFDADPTPSVNEQRREWQRVLDSFARHVTAIVF